MIKRQIYLNNFRGFTSQYVDLDEVTFLVGENSAGKTSFLSAVKLLSKFQSEVDFNSVELRLGQFSDIISIHAADKSSFDIGFMRFEEGQLVVQAARYIDGPNSLPLLSHLISLEDNVLTGIAFSDSNTKYERLVIRKGTKPENVFKKAIHLLEGDFTNELDSKIPRDMPFVLLLSILRNIAKSQTKNLELSFSFGSSELYQDLNWIAPIRTQPQRTYDATEAKEDAEGHHTPYVIKRALSGNSKKNRALKSALEKFGRESGLFTQIKIRDFDSKKSANSPFELLIELNEQELRINSVGYGVSQSLPVAVELIRRNKDSGFAIQQPEVHLHPKAQAALGDLIHRFSRLDDKHIIIETHSDFLIDRFRLAQQKSKVKLITSVLFFSRTKAGNKISRIVIDEKGRYDSNQPAGFRRFFLNEQLSLLDL